MTEEILPVAVPISETDEVANVWSNARHPGEPLAVALSDLPFRLVWHRSTDGMRLTDASGRVVMVNPAFCRMVGMSEEELVGRPFSVVYRAAERDRVLETGVERFARRAIQPHLVREMVLWNGRTMWFEASNSFVEEEGRPPLLLSIFRDITDRKRAEDEVRHARDYSENLIANAPVLIVRLDRFGRVRALNRTAEQLTGYRQEDLARRNWARRLVPRGLFAEAWKTFVRHSRGEEGSAFDAPLLTRSGEVRVIRWNATAVHENGRVVGLIAFGADVTAARANARVLQRYRLLLQHSSDIMLLLGPDGAILEANEAAAAAYGHSRDELLAMNTHDLCATDDCPALHATGLTQTVHQRRGGTAFPVEVSSRASRVGDEEVTLWVVRDITERRAAEADLERQAFHDPLTGLANRALFMDRLGHALAGAARRRDNAAILFLDLDRFKQVNDSLGHNAGDELLMSVARRLMRSLRAEDTAARFGGDEFTVLLENIADESEAVQVADRILQRLATPFRVAGREVYVTASIGIAYSRGEAHTPEDLLKAADLAMYQVKQGGRAGRAVFTAEMHPRAAARLELELDLRRAIGRGEFHLHYQPIVEMESGAVLAGEALVRWQHPRHGLMAPNQFVPLQEQIGLSDALTLWVLGEACRHRDEWLAQGRDLHAIINLCAAHMMDETFPDKVRDVLREHGADARRIGMEFTEAAMMPDPPRALKVLRRLDEMGVALGLDNFGSGYSSIAFLKEIPARVVKMDRSLLAALQDTGDDTLIRAALDLARTLGRKTVVEGVETAGAWHALKALGCHAAQGFLIAAPMPPEEFLRWQPPPKP